MDYVKPEEVRLAQNLLDPKFKGKIVSEDPVSVGKARHWATQFYIQRGEEFVKKVYLNQQVVYSRDARQMNDWLARGTYPICLSCREEHLALLRSEGFNISRGFTFSDMTPTLGASPWLLAALSNPPHPNAARVFVNWIASKEILEIYSRAVGYATTRSDVDESFLLSEVSPQPGVKYMDNGDWKWSLEKDKIDDKVRALLRKK
jgi:ABC-type Fe3+ transport system substrate-binding protein